VSCHFAAASPVLPKDLDEGNPEGGAVLGQHPAQHPHSSTKACAWLGVRGRVIRSPRKSALAVSSGLATQSSVGVLAVMMCLLRILLSGNPAVLLLITAAQQ